MRSPTLLASVLLLTTGALSQSVAGYKPAAGFVPDSKTAIAIAEAVLIPVYGKEQIESERPFHAGLKDGVWTVGGTLRCPDGKGGFTTDCDGGVAVLRLSKRDGRVLYMMHSE
jgi:hypothetical protein